MNIFVTLIRSAALLILRIYLVLMLVRAVMSWLFTDDDSSIYNFVVGVTEPVIAPVRRMLDKIEGLRALPVDLSFIVAYFILYAVLIILEVAA